MLPDHLRLSILDVTDRQSAIGDAVRAPYKDGWRHDILRFKGGIEDYCVTGEIDIQALRQFQSCPVIVPQTNPSSRFLMVLK